MPEIEVAHEGRTLWRGRVRGVRPGRSTALPATWAADVDPRGGPVAVRVLRVRLARGLRE